MKQFIEEELIQGEIRIQRTIRWKSERFILPDLLTTLNVDIN